MRVFFQAWRPMVDYARFLAAWTFSIVFPALCCLLLPFWGPATIWVRLAGFWARTTLRILGVRIQLVGRWPDRPCVFVANHQSLLDVIAMPALVPPTTRFVARQNLKYIPFWGWIFVLGGAIPIQRQGRGGGDVGRLRAGLAKLPAGWSLMIFPEGTRGRAKALRPFRRGAALCAAERNMPLVPVGIGKLDAVAPRESALLRAGTVVVAIGEPIFVRSDGPQPIAEATRKAQEAVAACVARADAEQQRPAAAKGKRANASAPIGTDPTRFGGWAL